MSLWSDHIKYLQGLIDTKCPMIYVGNWPLEHSRGWRWVANLDLGQFDNRQLILDYQMAHGVLNVTLGHPFNEVNLKPAPILGFCGMYVRDVDDIIKQARRELADDEMMHRWMEKEE